MHALIASKVALDRMNLMNLRVEKKYIYVQLNHQESIMFVIVSIIIKLLPAVCFRSENLWC